jgi:hypothetical protein
MTFHWRTAVRQLKLRDCFPCSSKIDNRESKALMYIALIDKIEAPCFQKKLAISLNQQLNTWLLYAFVPHP